MDAETEQVIRLYQENDRLKTEIKILQERLAIPAIHMQSLMDIERIETERLRQEIKLLKAELEVKKATE